MKRLIQKQKRRARRKRHVRKTVMGTADRPRLSVFKSNRYMYVQAIDDQTGTTLLSASSLEKELRELRRNAEGASRLGKIAGERLKQQEIETVVFDRNGYLYHGIVKAICDGVREAGIKV
jgi:large subunit ribosomal protein L18